MKNILLIVCDEMRGDCLGVSGHPDVKTPYLDSLALGGLRFDNAYSACPSCIPARAALMTGMSQDHTGRVGYKDGIRWNYPHTLAGEMTKAGYQTQCIGKMHVHPLRNSLGFQNIELHDGYLHYYRNSEKPYYENQKVADDYLWWLRNELGPQADITDTGIDCNSWLARPWIYDEKYHPTNWVTSRCLDFLRRRDRDKSFFLMASYVRPHAPFDAPKPFFDMYDNIELHSPAIGDWAEKPNESSRLLTSSEGCFDADMRRRAMIGYYACISHLDNQIGKLLDGLYFENLLSDTLIIFVSDHGELLFDHNMYRKSRPYEGSAHIPLIISGAGLKNRGVSHSLAELRDIMPTVLAAADAGIPDTVDGQDLLSDNFKREYIHGEHSGGNIGNQFIVTNHDKYIWFMQSGKEQYFNLEKDPHELHNAVNDSENANRISYLRSLLINELKNRPEGYTDCKKLISGRPQRDYLFDEK
ncbi:MAG: arylsulfatase [Clostridia bacterium]|nr:arylsulfatase [Clostridia bacterium]